MNWWEWLLIFIITILLIMLGLAIFNKMTEPTFSLIKDEWLCVKEEKRVRLQTIISGKVISTIPITQHECVEYKRQ